MFASTVKKNTRNKAPKTVFKCINTTRRILPISSVARHTSTITREITPTDTKTPTRSSRRPYLMSSSHCHSLCSPTELQLQLNAAPNQLNMQMAGLAFYSLPLDCRLQAAGSTHSQNGGQAMGHIPRSMHMHEDSRHPTVVAQLFVTINTGSFSQHVQAFCCCGWQTIPNFNNVVSKKYFVTSVSHINS